MKRIALAAAILAAFPAWSAKCHEGDDARMGEAIVKGGRLEPAR